MKPENPHAFPVPTHESLLIESTGMSLRDYFAAHALTGIIAEYARGNGTCMGMEHFPRNVAAHAYGLADAMLAERERKS